MRLTLKYILFLSILIFICSSINAYSINKLDSEMVVRNNGVCEIHEDLEITDLNSNIIIFNIIPVYDLIVKVNNKDVNFSYTLDTLTIYINDYSNANIDLDIIYLTDYFTTKQSKEWDINYFSVFKKNIDSLILQLPKDTEINYLSVDLQYINIIDDKFVINLNNLDNLDIKYSINPKKLNSKKKFNLIWIVLVIISIGIVIFMFLSKKKKTNNNKNNKVKELLLGLNENEQKIIKLLLEKENISQKALALKLFLPKGTISRNIKNLESKGYIIIKKYGVTHKIFLSSLFDKYKN